MQLSLSFVNGFKRQFTSEMLFVTLETKTTYFYRTFITPN